MISRRFFLKGTVATAAGLILPSWVVHAERYIEGEGEPFLEPLRSHQHSLYAVNQGDEYQLLLGDPFKRPKTNITWQEYFDRYTHVDTLEEYFEGEESEDIPKPDELVNGWLVYEALCYYHQNFRIADVTIGLQRA